MAVFTANGTDYFPYVIVIPDDRSTAGLELEDEIVEIDGRPTANLPLSGVRLLERGPVGSRAALKIRRGEEYITLSIVRVPFSE